MNVILHSNTLKFDFWFCESSICINWSPYLIYFIDHQILKETFVWVICNLSYRRKPRHWNAKVGWYRFYHFCDSKPTTVSEKLDQLQKIGEQLQTLSNQIDDLDNSLKSSVSPNTINKHLNIHILMFFLIGTRFRTSSSIWRYRSNWYFSASLVWY